MSFDHVGLQLFFHTNAFIRPTVYLCSQMQYICHPVDFLFRLESWRIHQHPGQRVNLELHDAKVWHTDGLHIVYVFEEFYVWNYQCISMVEAKTEHYHLGGMWSLTQKERNIRKGTVRVLRLAQNCNTPTLTCYKTFCVRRQHCTNLVGVRTGS